jgi:hypothetical protein
MSITYLSLEEVTHKYGVEKQVLTQLIEVGMIETHQTPTGDLLLLANKNGRGPEPQTKEEIIAANFAHLRGQWLSAYRAQKEHGIHHSNFINWARAGYIKMMGEGSRALRMDAADVAYCAWIYKQKKEEYGGRLAGVRLFDDTGNPYELKYPDLSAKRRSPLAD